jgi:hypothetical protein
MSPLHATKIVARSPATSAGSWAVAARAALKGINATRIAVVFERGNGRGFASLYSPGGLFFAGSPTASSSSSRAWSDEPSGVGALACLAIGAALACAVSAVLSKSAAASALCIASITVSPAIALAISSAISAAAAGAFDPFASVDATECALATFAALAVFDGLSAFCNAATIRAAGTVGDEASADAAFSREFGIASAACAFATAATFASVAAAPGSTRFASGCAATVVALSVVDVVAVRMLFVPCAMLLLGKLNWWPSSMPSTRAERERLLVAPGAAKLLEVVPNTHSFA